jgi:hypothetical protein
MNIQMKKLFPALLLLAFVFIASCRKDDFDEPSGDGQDPALVANTTIAQLKSGYVAGVFDSIETDIIISGIITADDKSGNFYKTLVIQDATAAIAIRVDVSDFYTRYPIGRRIFVKCKGLILGDYNALIQLGGYVDYTDPSELSVEPIPYALVNKFLFPGQYNLTVAPVVVTIPQLIADPNTYQNMLISLTGVQFIASDTGNTYADIPFQQSANRTIESCNSEQIIVRSSNYATFGDESVANGNGTLTAIFSVYGEVCSTCDGDAQLLLRDLYDVNLTGARCGSGGTGGGINETFSSQSTGTDISLPGWSNVAAVGNRYWRAGLFSGDTYAQATAFGSGLPAMESWLITPEFDLATLDTLTFRSSWGYFVHNGLSVWISTDYDGVDFASATWTQLSPTLAVQSDGQFTWIPSGNVPLTGFSGNAYVGFKYVGDGTTNTTTWRIDDVIVH